MLSPDSPIFTGRKEGRKARVHADWHAGQQYRVGEAIIELTKLREPCNALNVYGPAIKKEMKGLIAGYYVRVIRPGLIFPGIPISLIGALA